jgi:hypothetical protein
MDLDPHNWDPLSVDEVVALFRDLPAPWWIAGGWALDLFLGRTTRPHEDTDVVILRRDQLVVQEYFRRQWRLFKTHQPRWPHLAPWPAGEFLDLPVSDIWARRELDRGPWRFQLMLTEEEGDRWVYRRLRTIGGEIAGLGLTTDAGVPYLAPEIQLLYKSRTGRARDALDFRNVLPHLPTARGEWLLDGLRRQYPEGHAWMAPLVARVETPRRKVL